MDFVDLSGRSLTFMHLCEGSFVHVHVGDIAFLLPTPGAGEGSEGREHGSASARGELGVAQRQPALDVPPSSNLFCLEALLATS